RSVVQSGRTQVPKHYRFVADALLAPLGPDGSPRFLEFREGPEGSLPADVLCVPHVKKVIIGGDNLVVKLDDDSHWGKVQPIVTDILDCYVARNDVPPEDTRAPPSNVTEAAATVELIDERVAALKGAKEHPMTVLETVLDMGVRPGLLQDGGNISLLAYEGDFESGVATIQLEGHCKGCPHSQQTLNNFVLQVLQRYIPGISLNPV
ncbi:hypothetical protein KIPB_009700, partial [Kipferlia bialata]